MIRIETEAEKNVHKNTHTNKINIQKGGEEERNKQTNKVMHFNFSYNCEN